MECAPWRAQRVDLADLDDLATLVTMLRDRHSDLLLTRRLGQDVYTREAMRWIEDATVPWDRPRTRVSGRTQPFPPPDRGP